jgi:hypothetical protein
MRADASVRVTHEQAAMGAVTAPELAQEASARTLAATAPSAQPIEAAADKPALEASAVGALNPASVALGAEDKPAVTHTERARPSKRSALAKKRAAKRKHKAQFQKRHKAKKARHAKRRAKKG